MKMNQLAIHGGTPTFQGTWPKWPIWGEEELDNIRAVLDSPYWGGTTRGPMLQQIAEQFAAYCDCKYGVPMANGTVTLELSLRAFEIGEGEEVIIPPYTFVAVPMSVLNVGATPVFADIHSETLCLDPDAVAQAVTPQTKAIIVVHTAGQPADMPRILEIAQKHGLKVIEDCAQSHGAILNGKKVGSFGDCGSYSFQQFKNMTSGEGGMVVTNNSELAELLDFGLSKFGRIRGGEWYDHHRLATNATLTEIQAAILLAQFDRLEEQTERRAKAGKRLLESLAQIPGIRTFPWAPGTGRHGYHLFVFAYDAEQFGGMSRTDFVATLNAELNTKDLAGELYPRTLYRTSMFNPDRKSVAGAPGRTFRVQDCPNAEEASRCVVMIHQRALLAKNESINAIIESIEKIRRCASDR
ncbi:MAG TPA: DegT/DnrJ/EryC1/StrS family aminotransferase [bacterium]|nr:DegT/DnrJ/EryC1/StrS family aminotransferase [bacterium]HQL63105.1 DegT/DnrJ/EryC1/StrS family aminotransferase [bacterium]